MDLYNCKCVIASMTCSVQKLYIQLTLKNILLKYFHNKYSYSSCSTEESYTDLDLYVYHEISIKKWQFLFIINDCTLVLKKKITCPRNL